MGRRLTYADALLSWRVDGELRGGHTVAETLQFVNDLEDVEERLALPEGFALAGDIGPRGVGRLRGWFGR